MRAYTFSIREQGDMYDTGHHQTVFNKDGSPVYEVQNLNDCPEDAIIGRKLVDAIDYIQAVQYGINLAKLGYDGVAWEWREN